MKQNHITVTVSGVRIKSTLRPTDNLTQGKNMRRGLPFPAVRRLVSDLSVLERRHDSDVGSASGLFSDSKA